jgi:hypothetical protein
MQYIATLKNTNKLEQYLIYGILYWYIDPLCLKDFY